MLDDACGTGAAVEWIIREFNEKGVRLEIYATDHSAVMMNEVENRRERLGWGINVECFLMDAQVIYPHVAWIDDVGLNLSKEYLHTCFYELWDYVNTEL